MFDTRFFVALCIIYGIAMALVYTVSDSTTIQLIVTFVGAGVIAIAAMFIGSENKTDSSD